MFIQINTADYHNQYAAFNVKDSTGTLLHIGVVKMTDLTALAGVKLPADAVCYLTVIGTHADPMVAANWATQAATDAARPDLRNAITDWVLRLKKGRRRVQCDQTGDVFDSVLACCRALDIAPPNLYNHLKNPDVFKTVKGGKTFKYIC